jgi:uncharacterized membrane protein YkoI
MRTRFDEIDAQRAKEIAKEFLQQHHSTFDFESIQKDGVWLVKVRTSLFDDIIKQVRIDAKTGRIISVE